MLPKLNVSKSRDPNLFYISMQVRMQRNVESSNSLKTKLELDDESKPLQLQQQSLAIYGCEVKFYLQCRDTDFEQIAHNDGKVGFVRVKTTCLLSCVCRLGEKQQPIRLFHTQARFKGIIISEKTNTSELIQLLINSYPGYENSPISDFQLFEICRGKHRGYARRLRANERPLHVQRSWPQPKNYSFELRETAADHYEALAQCRSTRLMTPDASTHSGSSSSPLTPQISSESGDSISSAGEDEAGLGSNPEQSVRQIPRVRCHKCNRPKSVTSKAGRLPSPPVDVEEQTKMLKKDLNEILRLRQERMRADVSCLRINIRHPSF